MNRLLKIILAIKNIFNQKPKIHTNDKGVKLYQEARFKKGEINKSFYYIRHGETDVNKYNIAPENPDVSLNEEGKNQVKKSLNSLLGKNIKIIIASPLLRTKQTAEIISKTLNVPIIYNNGLKESDLGFIPGEDKKISQKSKIWLQGEEMHGVESLYLFQKRIHRTIKEIVNMYEDALIVSHGIYFKNLNVLLNEQEINSENAIPYYFIPIDDASSKEFYKVIPV